MPEDVRRFMMSMREGGGASASPEEILGVMRGFKDNVTLDHLYRDQVRYARYARYTSHCHRLCVASSAHLTTPPPPLSPPLFALRLSRRI